MGKARRVAAETIGHRLSPEAAAYVDVQVAPVAHKIRPAQLDRHRSCVPTGTAATATTSPPYATGGATCSCQIAPLCRHHHRIKTHTGWTYTLLEPGTYHWTSPHGYHYLRDHTGTLDTSRD